MKIKFFNRLLLLTSLFVSGFSFGQVTQVHPASTDLCSGQFILDTQSDSTTWLWKKNDSIVQYGGYYIMNLCYGNDYKVEINEGGTVTPYPFFVDSIDPNLTNPCISYYFFNYQYQGITNGLCNAMARFNPQGNIYHTLTAVPSINPNQVSIESGTGNIIISDLCAENYFFTFSDTITGCSYTSNINIYNISYCAFFDLNMHTILPNTTIGTCDGSIFVEATGGQSPYNYNWEGLNLHTDTISNLCYGLYSLIVTDAIGCVRNQTFYSYTDSILNPPIPPYQVSAVVHPETAIGACDGSAEIIPFAGVSPYTFLHSSGETTAIVENKCAGIYSVQVTDLSNQILNLDYVIYGPGNSSAGGAYNDSIPVDSLFSELIAFCEIDYSTIDSVFVHSFTNYGNDSLAVTWAILSIEGDTTFTTNIYNQGLNNGVSYITLSLYCPGKSMGNYWFSSDQVYFSPYLGIGEAEMENASIYQTVSNKIIIRLPSEGKAEVGIFDLTGKRISNQKLYGDHFEVELPQIATGTYVLQLVYNGVSTSRLIRK